MDSSSPQACGRNPFWGTIAKNAEECAEKVALRIVNADGSEGLPLTYGELRDGGLAAAAFLHSIGVTRGSIVFTAVANTEASVALSIGVARLGAVWAPADQDLTLEQIVRLLGVYEPAAAFLADDKVDAVTLGGNKALKMPSWETLLESAGQELPAELPIEDDAAALMLLTSGTTGFPKSVMTPASVLRKMATRSDYIPPAEQAEAMVYFGSPAWISYSFIFLNCTNGKKEFVLGQGYTKGLFFDAVTRHSPPHLFFWPEVVVDFATLSAELQKSIASFAKSVVYGGARTPAAALLKLIRALPDTAIIQGYGSSEAGSISQLTAADHAAVREAGTDERAMRRLHSAGKCVGQVRIVDDQAVPVPVGVVGSIQILPADSSFTGYYKNPTATAAKWTADGWFITGDLGRLDEDGYLYLDGRDSETIVLLSGDNVYPNEIESVIAELPGVVEVAVVKVVTGESAISEVGAFVRVVDEAALTESDVKKQCQLRLGQVWSHPTHIFIQTEKLPRNRNGKCMKAALSERASASLRGSRRLGGA